MKKRIYIAIFISVLSSVIIFVRCPFGVEPDKTLHPLNPQDSLAVRAILDSNGLEYIDLSDYDDRKRVIVQRYSYVVKLKLDTFNLEIFKFISNFKFLDSLSSLRLNNNRIKSIQVDDTITFKYSTIMNLSYNEVDSFPEPLLKINNISSLYLENNKLSYIPLEIMGKTFQQFKIRYNKLTNVPDTLKDWLSQYDPDWEKYQSR